jgi:hypothetical protein
MPYTCLGDSMYRILLVHVKENQMSFEPYALKENLTDAIDFARYLYGTYNVADVWVCMYDYVLHSYVPLFSAKLHETEIPLSREEEAEKEKYYEEITKWW